MTANAFRTPKRVSITIPHCTYQQLLQLSDQQGRSLSNLAAYLLESSLAEEQAPQAHTLRPLQSLRQRLQA